MARTAINDNGTWRYEGFQTVDPTPPPTPGRETLKTIQGGHEQRWPSYANTLLKRPIYACKQCHPSPAGRAVWRSGVTTFINDWKADPWVPRLSILHGLLMDTETISQQLAGAYDAEYEWLADKIKNEVFDHPTKGIGRTHPITGNVIRGCDLFGWDIVHEMNIAKSPYSTIPDAAHPDASPLNTARMARHAIDVLRAQQPSFESSPVNRPLIIWCPAQSASADSAIDSYLGDDYVDVIAMDVYAGGVNTNIGPWDSTAQHNASWQRTLSGYTLSLNGFFTPFADAVQSNAIVARCNSSAHPGEADLNGGRHEAKPMGFIEFGMIAVDRQPAGGDGVIDGGTGDNTVTMTGFLDYVQQQCALPLKGYQATVGFRVAFMNYFDINVKAARTSHRLTPETDPTKYIYDFTDAKNIFVSRVAGIGP